MEKSSASGLGLSAGELRYTISGRRTHGFLRFLVEMFLIAMRLGYDYMMANALTENSLGWE